MNFSKTVVKHPKGTLVLFLSIIIFGSVALPFINKDIFPKIDYPVITIVTSLENKTPQEIRNLVTVPMEEILSTTSGLRNIKSVSRYGESIITLYFDWGINLDMTFMETREKLDFARSILPQGTSRPVALRFDPNSDPVMTIGLDILNDNIKGGERSYIRKNIIPLFERIEGVAFAEIVGGNEREVKVDVSLDKLYADNLSIDEVVKAIEENNVEYPVGDIDEDKTTYTVNIEGKIDNYNQLNEIVVGRNDQGTPIYLKDIADIRLGDKEKNIIFRIGGKPGAALNIYKEGDANIVRTSDNISEKLPFIIEKTKKDLSYRVIQDNSRYVKESINDIVTSALIGVALTFFVLYLFLEDITASIIVGLAIPITIVMTIFFMYLFNISINLISLTGLSIGIGSMVDSNIVIIENIKRYSLLNKDDATLIKAANEVSAPVISSILTNIAVFLPIVFVSGIASSIFRELSLVVTFSHLSTLFTSILLTPALYKLLENRLAGGAGSRKPVFAPLIEKYKAAYLNLLGKAMDHSGILIVSLCVLIIISIGAFFSNKKEVLPLLSQNSFNINIKFPPNYSISRSEEDTAEIETLLSKNPQVDYYYSIIGDYSALSSFSKAKKNNIASVKVFLKKGASAGLEIGRVKADTGKIFNNADFSFEENQTAFSKLFPSDNEIYVMGTPADYITKVSSYITNIISRNGITNLSMSSDEEETVSLQFDRTALNNSGLSTKSVADIAGICINGKIATKLETPDSGDLDVNVKLGGDVFSFQDNLYKILLKPPHGENILLSTICTITDETKTTEINRYNQQEMVSIRFTGPGARLKRIQDQVNALGISKSTTLRYSWDTQEIKKSIDSLTLVLILSIVVIFVIIAFQFESIRKSLLIMVTIPLIFIGLSPMLLLFGVSINAISLVGIILLVGIVVDNAIVMVDFYERNLGQARSKNDVRQLVIQGSGIRFRPIVMTGCTTVVALIPLIFFPGEGMEFQRILSVTIAGGFIFATAITLFFIPTLYYIVEKRSIAAGKK